MDHLHQHQNKEPDVGDEVPEEGLCHRNFSVPVEPLIDDAGDDEDEEVEVGDEEDDGVDGSCVAVKQRSVLVPRIKLYFFVPTFTDFYRLLPTVNRKFLITDFRLLSTSVKPENFIDFYRSQKKVKDPRCLALKQNCLV